MLIFYSTFHDVVKYNRIFNGILRNFSLDPSRADGGAKWSLGINTTICHVKKFHEQSIVFLQNITFLR